MPSPSPGEILDRPLLRRLAGEQSFARGEQCYVGGQVGPLRVTADRVSARVSGPRTYRVKLWRHRGELRFRCDCADGRSETFCEHCVAVGLAWLSYPDEDGVGTAGGPESRRRESARREDSRRQLTGYLRTLSKERLGTLLLEAIEYDEILRRRLVLEATQIAKPPGARGSRATPLPDILVVEYRQLLLEAVRPTGVVDYQAMQDYAQGIEEAVAPLGAWLDRGWHEAVVGLVEFTLVELDAAADRVDLGDPILNRIYDELQGLHLKACRGAGADVEALAGRLLQYELDGGLGVFNDALITYGDVLGPSGRAAWRTLLTREWQQLFPTGAAAGKENGSGPWIDHRRFQAQMLMERLARADGDDAAMFALKRADLRSVRDYIALAEWLEGAGRLNEAIDFATEASTLFTATNEKTVWRDFLLASLPRAGRHEEAFRHARAQFAEAPDLEHLRALRVAGRLVPQLSWEDFRTDALALAGQRAAETGADGSRLVEMLLDEGLPDEAWKIASGSGCRPDLWLLLARQRKDGHPAEAFEVYRRDFERIMQGRGSNHYGEALERVASMQDLASRSGLGVEFQDFLGMVRATYRTKRTFLRLVAATVL